MSNTKQTLRLMIADKLYRCMFGTEGGMKLKQLVKTLDEKDITPELAYDIMKDDSRFETVQHKWFPSVRFGNRNSAVTKIMTDALEDLGGEASAEDITAELIAVIPSEKDKLIKTAPKLLANKSYFFAGKNGYGPASALLDVSADDPDDIIFDNDLPEDEAAELAKAAKGSKSYIAAAEAALKAAKGTADGKLLAFAAWSVMGSKFKPVEFYEAVSEAEGMRLLSDGNVYTLPAASTMKKNLKAMAEEASALDFEDDINDEPIVVAEEDVDKVVEKVLDAGSVGIEEALDELYDISPADSNFEQAKNDLEGALKEKDNIMWGGGGRWMAKPEITEDIAEIPASLLKPDVEPYETPEGDLYDLMLEPEGLDSELKLRIYDPLAEDVCDEDPTLTDYQPAGDRQICVLTYRHKIEGTFPLCQINPDFFGKTPDIIPITLTSDGKEKTVFVNNTTRLIYGLKDFYKDIEALSGAIFYIVKTETPGKFRFLFNGESNPELTVDMQSSMALLDIKDRYEAGNMSIYDVIVEILGMRKKGVTFAQLVNDVNIVRRCSRVLVASILSSYHVFHTKGKTGLWTYDEKKQSQGFNKSKRKYIKK